MVMSLISTSLGCFDGERDGASDGLRWDGELVHAKADLRRLQSLRRGVGG